MIDLALIRLAIDAAKRANIPAPLVLAFCSVESGWNPWAWRPEPRFRFLWNAKQDCPFRRLTLVENASETPPADFPGHPEAAGVAAEWWGQQSSWGLMQVMGSTAREMGFDGPYLSQLCDPAIGLGVGTHYFVLLMSRYSKPEPAIAAYNAGTPQHNPDGTYVNQAYVDKVLAARDHWQEWLDTNPVIP